MKVTAIIDDDMIKEAMVLSKTDTITDALKVALHEYITTQKLKKLGKNIKEKPLEFKYSADKIRSINRER